MHVRRALLLFAIVLGMAALAASLSRPREERAQPTDTAPSTAGADSPTLAPAPGSSGLDALVFDAARDQRRKLELGVAATVEVEVDEAGQVEIPLLGLSGSAEPLTPARFDVLPPDEGAYEILFTPASGDEARPAGTLRVVAPEG